MSPDAILAVQKIMDYCHEKWLEADRAQGETPDMKTGRKVGYNHVLQYARKLLDETPWRNPTTRTATVG